MALTTNEEKDIEKSKRIMNNLELDVLKMQKFFESAESLSKIDTRGRKPDFSTFSDEDLRAIFRVGKANDNINMIERQAMGDNANSRWASTALLKTQAEDLSREELIEAVDTWMKGHNYHVPPNDILEAQIRCLDGAGSLTRDRSEAQALYFSTKEGVEKRSEEYSDPELENRFRALKLQENEFNQKSLKVKPELIQQGLKASLESAAQRNLSAKETSNMLHDIQGFAQVFSEASKQNLQLDLRGIDLTGLDLSQSDLTGMKVNAGTLARAKGLDTVKGVDPEIMKNVRALPGLEKEQARLQKKADDLQKPWSFERFKAFFKKGGAEQELKETALKLQEMKATVLKVADPVTFENVQKGEAAQLLKETMKSPSLSEGFKKFAGKEGLGTEMNFLEEVEALKRDALRGEDLGDLKVRAFGIQQRYFATGADQRVDVDFAVRDKVNELMEGFDDLDHKNIQEIFTPAQKEVQNKLASGPMQRFRQTQEQPKQGKEHGESVRDNFKRPKVSKVSGQGNHVKM